MTRVLKLHEDIKVREVSHGDHRENTIIWSHVETDDNIVQLRITRLKDWAFSACFHAWRDREFLLYNLAAATKFVISLEVQIVRFFSFISRASKWINLERNWLHNKVYFDKWTHIFSCTTLPDFMFVENSESIRFRPSFWLLLVTFLL